MTYALEPELILTLDSQLAFINPALGCYYFLHAKGYHSQLGIVSRRAYQALPRKLFITALFW